MTEKRTLEKQCKEAGKRVGAWLNSSRSTGHPVTKLIVWTRTMLHAYEPSKLPFERKDFEDYQTEINAIARRYPGIRAVRGLGGRLPESGFFPLEAMNTADQIPWQIVNDVGMLVENGDLWRIRRCWLPSCKLAFCARVHKQKFHTIKCKRKWRSQQPDFKIRRAKYMRGRYHKQFSSTRRKP